MAWRRVVDSARVGFEQVVGVDVGSRELVVWRDGSGTAVVMDARCPHQWSHLEAEGVVDGDEIVCAAHFWRFDARGHGTKVNIKGRRDEKADIEVFPSRELAGVIEVDLPDRGAASPDPAAGSPDPGAGPLS